MRSQRVEKCDQRPFVFRRQLQAELVSLHRPRLLDSRQHNVEALTMVVTLCARLFQQPLQLFLHLFTRSGRAWLMNQVLHFVWISFQIVQLIHPVQF